MTAAGDIVHGDGRGSVSIYGKYFEDENLALNHTGPGFLGMANRGPDTNGCQFYITTMASPWLNGHHTIFGKVVAGKAYVHVIEKVCPERGFHSNAKLKFYARKINYRRKQIPIMCPSRTL